MTKLYIASTYGNGCPDNAAGRRVGYGVTPAGAIEACEPWANQAPWFRAVAKPIHVADRTAESPGAGEYEVCTALEWIGEHAEHLEGDARAHAVLAVAHLQARRWASAVQAAARAGALK